MLNAKHFILSTIGLFLISILVTSSLFSIIISTGGVSAQEGIADGEPAEATTPPPSSTLTSTECPPGTRAGNGTASDGECISDIASGEEDFFFLEDKRIPVTIGVDELGIAARDNVTSGQLQEFLSGFQLSLSLSTTEHIHLWTSKRPQPTRDCRSLPHYCQRGGTATHLCRFHCCPTGG